MSLPPSTSLPSSGVGIVKAILSGDTVVLRTAIRSNVPFKMPLERTISLANVCAPRSNELGAWQSKLFLSQRIIGKEVKFQIHYSATSQNGSSRDYGSIYFRDEETKEPVHVSKMMVSEGFVKLKTDNISRNKDQESINELTSLEEQAVAQKKGLNNANQHIHYIIKPFETSEEAAEFLASHQGQSLRVFIDYVRDGSSFRAIVLPLKDPSSANLNSVYLPSLQIQLSGIRCPFVLTAPSVPEPYSEEAKCFTESRLLHRMVTITLESLVNNTTSIFYASVQPNIAQLLVKEGLARITDASTVWVTGGPSALRKAEQEAIHAKLRLYQGAVVANRDLIANNLPRECDARVVRIYSGDSISVVVNYAPPMAAHVSLPFTRVFLSHVRLPKDHDAYLPLAKEFLRQRLIGQKIKLVVDYILPKVDTAERQQEERAFVSVVIARKSASLKGLDLAAYDALFEKPEEYININTWVIAEGLAQVNRVKQGDTQRAASYDLLLLAESRAQQVKRAIHSNALMPTSIRLNDASESASKARQHLVFLKKDNKKIRAIVDLVVSGCKFKIVSAREHCVFLLILSGIRSVPAYSFQAMQYAALRCNQQEVDIAIDNVDKSGHFIGHVYLGDGSKLAHDLIKEGFAMVVNSGDREMAQLQEDAVAHKKGAWSEHQLSDFKTATSLGSEDTETGQEEKLEYKMMDGVSIGAMTCDDRVRVTSVEKDVIFIQNENQLNELKDLNRQLNVYCEQYVVGDKASVMRHMVVGVYSKDGCWYRGKVMKMRDGEVTAQLIDYGDQEVVDVSDVKKLPEELLNSPPKAKPCRLAYIILAKEGLEDVFHLLNDARSEYRLSLAYRGTPTSTPYYCLINAHDGKNMNEEIIKKGLGVVDRRLENSSDFLQKLVRLNEEAQRERRGLYQYGDIKINLE